MKVCIACDEIYADFMESCPVCGCKDLKGQEFAAQNTKKTKEEEFAELAKENPMLAEMKASSRLWDRWGRTSKDGPFSVRSNAIIQDSRYFLTAMAENVITYLTTFIQKGDIEFKSVSMSFRDFLRMCGLSYGGRDYNAVKKAIQELHSKVVWIEYEDPYTKQKTFRVTNWLDQSIVNESKEEVILKLNDNLADIFLNLSGKFTKIEALWHMNLSLVWSKRLYLYAQSLFYRKTRTYETYIPLQKLKEQLGAYEVTEEGFFGKDRFPIWSKFRERCLDPAVKEINEKTDLVISYELRYTIIGKARTVEGVEFTISMKNQAERKILYLNYEIGNTVKTSRNKDNDTENLGEDPSDGWV